MPRSINLTGTPGKQYDLDELSTKNTRGSADEELLVQVWYSLPIGQPFSNQSKCQQLRLER